jgi:hypothetical protein
LKTIEVPISCGDLFDKISILTVKSENIKNEAKLTNIHSELNLLWDKVGDWADWHKDTHLLYRHLFQVNKKLWDVEDNIRNLDSEVFPLQKWAYTKAIKSFVPQPISDYIELAQSVYRLNDKRAKIKRELNKLNKSSIVEEKSYNELS